MSWLWKKLISDIEMLDVVLPTKLLDNTANKSASITMGCASSHPVQHTRKIMVQPANGMMSANKVYHLEMEVLLLREQLANLTDNYNRLQEEHTQMLKDKSSVETLKRTLTSTQLRHAKTCNDLTILQRDYDNAMERLHERHIFLENTYRQYA